MNAEPAAMHLVEDKRVLRKLAAAGHITWPIHKGACYVDETASGTCFSCEGKTYRIRYSDGCFYPYLFDVSKE